MKTKSAMIVVFPSCLIVTRMLVIRMLIAGMFIAGMIGIDGAALLPTALASPARGVAAQDTAGQAAAVIRRLGTIKTINGSAITLAQASGPDVAVNVQPNARILRLAPGEKDFKNAAPIQLQELQVGDAIRVRGYASADAQSVAALEVIVITRSTVDAVGDQIRQDWQKRGMGGLVSAVDPATGTLTISVTGFAGTKTIAVHSSPSTIFRRYAPDSVKFEDARTSTLQQIHPGDQLRARGARSADGIEVTAEEIVTGSFRNVAGTINSVDASAGTVSVQDLLSNRTVQVKITADSQLHKIPEEIAHRFAMRLKGSMLPGTPGAASSSSASSSPPAQGQGQGTQASPSSYGSGSGGSGMGGGGGGMRPGGGFDLQQMLNRMPAVTLADLHKGDAVMMVTTQGTPSSASTAITLLSGVEPILEAAPKGSQAMMLAPWSLGGAPGGDAGNQ
jgi:hypothetical protein